MYIYMHVCLLSKNTQKHTHVHKISLLLTWSSEVTGSLPNSSLLIEAPPTVTWAVRCTKQSVDTVKVRKQLHYSWKHMVIYCTQNTNIYMYYTQTPPRERHIHVYQPIMEPTLSQNVHSCIFGHNFSTHVDYYSSNCSLVKMNIWTREKCVWGGNIHAHNIVVQR